MSRIIPMYQQGLPYSNKCVVRVLVFSAPPAMGNSLKIGGVEIKEELGAGSYGVVYKAKWNGRFAAVKVLREDMLWYHPKALEDFKKECEFFRVLKHPNIVEMFEVLFPENRSPVLIMELMYCDLKSYYKNSKTSPKIALDEVIRIMLDIGEGLKFLHDRMVPIVHRDIKSNNILLDTKQRAKIADLGQAKEFPGLGFGARVSATPVPGTTVYMAPETFPCSSRQSQAARHRVDYGAEIDVFSFGVVLLEVTVGHFPCPKPLFTPFTRGKFSRISFPVDEKIIICFLGDIDLDHLDCIALYSSFVLPFAYKLNMYNYLLLLTIPDNAV